MTILCDMDGVLVDFVGGAIKSHNRNDKYEDITQHQLDKLWGISKEEFWSKLEGYNWWLNLKPYDYAEKFMKELQKIDDVVIATACPKDPEAASGKLAWLNKYFGIQPSSVMIGKNKHLMAGNGILVDDYLYNIEKFVIKGGRAMLFPQPWNRAPKEMYDNNWRLVLDSLKEYYKD